MRVVLIAAVALGLIRNSSSQQLEQLLTNQCDAAPTELFCNAAFGLQPLCIWDALGNNGAGLCSLPVLTDAPFCDGVCGDSSVEVFSGLPTCSCTDECVASGNCCPGYESRCVTTIAPSESTTMSPTSSPATSTPTDAPSTTPLINLDSCICYPNTPGCHMDERVGNWTGCGEVFGRLRTSGQRCYCDNQCHATSAGCCPDYEAVCVTNSPSNTPTPQPTASPSMVPSQSPSRVPTREPTARPTPSPSDFPTTFPSSQPSVSPSTLSPTVFPTPRYGTCDCTDNSSACVQREHNGFTYCGTTISRLTEEARHCYCDDACVSIGNCCPDYESLCITGSPTSVPTQSTPTLTPTPGPTPLFGTCRCTGEDYHESCNNDVYPDTENYTLCGSLTFVLNLDGSRCSCNDACVENDNCCPDYDSLCVITTTTTTISTVTSTTTLDKFYTPLEIEPALPPYMNEARTTAALFAIEFMLTAFGHPLDVRDVQFQNGVRRQESGPSQALASFWDLGTAERVRDAGCLCDSQMTFEFEGAAYYVALQTSHADFLPPRENVVCETSCSPTTTSTTTTSSTETTETTVSSTSTTFTTTTTLSTTTISQTTTTTDTTITSTSTTETVTSTTLSSTTRTITSITVTTTTTESTTTMDPCLAITCAIDCNDECGWRLIIDHPNEGQCETGEVTSDAERLLGCQITPNPGNDPIILEQDAESSTEAWIYLVVVFVILGFAAVGVMYYTRSQRKSEYDINASQLPYQTQKSQDNTIALTPIPTHVHEEQPEPIILSQQSILEEQERVREESRRARQQIEELAAQVRQAQQASPVPRRSSTPQEPPKPPVRARPTRSKPRIAESELPMWYHGVINEEITRARIERSGIRNGRFLIRKDREGNYILAVAHRGQVKSFYITVDEYGFLELHNESGDSIGMFFEDLPDLVKAVSSDILPTGWRVQVREAVDKNTGEFVSVDVGVVERQVSEPLPPIPQRTEASQTVRDEYLSVKPPEEEPTVISGKLFDPMDSSTWLHGVTQGKEAAFRKMDTVENGVFLVERHSSPNAYVLNVIYKGKGTRHLIAPDESGVLVITKRRYGDSKTIEGLIDRLSDNELPNGWPVKLTRPILVSGDEEESRNKASVAPRMRAQSDMTDLTSELSYLHGVTVNKETTFELIKAFDPTFPNGLFLIEREKNSERYVLNVCYKGKPTRHLIAPNSAGILQVNNRQYGDHKTLKSLVMALSSPTLPPGWPVKLDRAVPPGFIKSKRPVTVPEEQIAEEVIAPPTHAQTEATSIPATVPAAVSSSDIDWVHPDVLDKVTGKEWSTKLAGTEKNGRFIVRTQNLSQEKFVLSVVYKNKMTEHLIQVSSEGNSKINGRQYGNLSSVNDIVARLSTNPMPRDSAHDKPWPAPLIEGLDPKTGSWVSTTTGSWFHKTKNGKELTRAEAESLINASESPSGTFIVRESVDANEYVLSVVYKGRPTHHLIRKVGAHFRINGKAHGQTWSTIEEIIDQLSQPDGARPATWPVKLLV